MAMPERRTRSPPLHGNKDHEDVSDDDTLPHSHNRDKFRRERSVERNPGESDRYDYKKRPRTSPAPSDEHRHKRHAALSPPHSSRGHTSRGPRGPVRDTEQGDRYVPNYDRDGYVPAPRYTHGPDPQHAAQGLNHPLMNDMMMNNWSSMARPATVDPQQLNFLMPYKQFSDNLRNTHARSYFTEEELHSRYLSYKQTYATRQLTEFFKSNKDKIWFLEKYHPVHSLAHEQDTKKRRRHDYDVFMAGLERGEYDDVNYDGHPDQVPSAPGATTATATSPPSLSTHTTSHTTSQDTSKQEDRQKMEEGEGEGEEEYENKLVIKTVPPTIPREKIIEMCSKVDGFEYLALSEPNISKKFHRVGWIQFSAGTDMEQAHTHLDGQKIDDFVFHVAMNKKNQTVPRIPRFTFDISNSFSRLKKDFEQAQALARKLEESLGEKMHGLEAVLKRAKAVKERTGMKLDHTGEEGVNSDGELPEASNTEQEMEKRNLKKELDLVIAYLRHVHMYCYYCALECNSREELSRKCVEPHYRRIPIESNAKYSKNDKANYWLQNLDHRIELKLYTPKDGKLESLGGKVIENELSAFVKTQVHKEHEAKYKCKVGDCSKAFKGYDFVEKHIFSKHPEEVERIREDVTYYNNYVLDPNHVLPVMNPAPGQSNVKQHNVPYIPSPNGPSSTFMMNTMNGMRPPNLISMPAATGTQWKQIPRIGFADNNTWSALNVMGRETPRAGTSSSTARNSMDIDSLPRDPRQVKSYVDLDAPAEGDANISFY